jgi:site-specific DNA-methyltransferase (adenine-specific)
MTVDTVAVVFGSRRQESLENRRAFMIHDPFCRCGTTLHAALKLSRQWISIDVTYRAINLSIRRLRDAPGEGLQFEEKVQPTDFPCAQRLAELDKFQFQNWTLSLIGARSLKKGEGKRVDRGVDGLMYFYDWEGEATDEITLASVAP